MVSPTQTCWRYNSLPLSQRIMLNLFKRDVDCLISIHGGLEKMKLFTYRVDVSSYTIYITSGARASAAAVLSYFSWNVLGSAQKWGVSSEWTSFQLTTVSLFRIVILTLFIEYAIPAIQSSNSNNLQNPSTNSNILQNPSSNPNNLQTCETQITENLESTLCMVS